MSGIVSEIVSFLGKERDGTRLVKRKPRQAKVHQEGDTVTISAEAWRLLAGDGGEDKTVESASLE